MIIDRKILALPPNKQFGALLRRMREDVPLTQIQAAGKFVDQTGTAASWQSILARIESGSSSVKPEHLEMFAKVYGVPLERIATYYAATKIFRKSPSAPHSGSEDAFFLSNIVEAKSLASIAEWEAGLKARSVGNTNAALWIVSPTFVDDEDSKFLAVVAKLVLEKVNLTYFVAERDLSTGEKFDRFLDRLTAKLVVEVKSSNSSPNQAQQFGRVDAYGLNRDDLAWFTSSLVIANPDDIQAGSLEPSGYMIVPVDGLHSLGIPIESRQLSGLVSRIKRQTEQIDDGHLKREKRTDALASHQKFKKEFSNE